MALPVKTGVMRAFPDSLACDFAQSRSWRNLSGMRSAALLMRLGFTALRGSNPRSSAP